MESVIWQLVAPLQIAWEFFCWLKMAFYLWMKQYFPTPKRGMLTKTTNNLSLNVKLQQRNECLSHFNCLFWRAISIYSKFNCRGVMTIIYTARCVSLHDEKRVKNTQRRIIFAAAWKFWAEERSSGARLRQLSVGLGGGLTAPVGPLLYD